VHRSHGRLERTEAGVLEGLAGREHRLFPDDARTENPLFVAVAVGDDPLAAHQLGRLGSNVRDPDAIGEEVLLLGRHAAVRQV
jgi:hypothetical protein